MAAPNIDWNKKENASAHHTDQYTLPALVLRRGQPFSVKVNQTEEGAAGNLTFTVETGSTAALQAKTRVEFGISSTASRSSWSAVQTSAASDPTSVSISSPANAAIGRYKLGLKTGSSGSSNLGEFALLFNPWISDDEVFMNDNAEREEYVLSEFGLVFVGNFNHISHFGWNYGQFQNEILDICFAMLDRSRSYLKDPTSDLRRRNDPKYVGRVLSAMVNSNDDNGVVEGNWSGNYSGGANPSSWTGSVDLLRKWKQSGFKPVRYGQCWVFAGVLATVLRCLGIPTRTISNFNSAHDTDKNLIVDIYYDNSGNPLSMSRDSVWNFHVWNEGWFLRSDLGPQYKGWQILDATPQERSEGIYQCGPASLTAIKEGDVDLKYDSPFVFAEVNADRIIWKYDPETEEKTKLHHDTKSVGQFTSTKAVGSDTRQDVTNDYKWVEGSDKERAVYQKAREKLNLNTLESISASMPEKSKVSGKFKLQSPPKVGQDVNLLLTLTNLVSATNTLMANLTMWSIIYTGKPIHEVWKNSLPVTLGPEEEKAFPITIPYAAYQQHLTTDNMIRATALCQVQEGTDAVVERDITLDNPGVTLKVLGPVKVGQEAKVEVAFTNPLNEEVKNCVVLAEGSDLLPNKLKIEAPPVKAKQSSQVSFAITPSKSGTKQLLINFNCDKFKDIKAFKTVNVAD